MSRGRPKRLARKRFASEADWMTSVIKWLDWRYPGPEHQAKRVAKWHRLEAEAQAYYSRQRLLELLTTETLTPDEADELGRLTIAYRKSRSTKKEA